jgi:hypothetical protein
MQEEPADASDLTGVSADGLDRLEAAAQQTFDHPVVELAAQHAQIERHYDADDRTPTHLREEMRAAMLAGVTRESVKEFAALQVRQIQAERARRGGEPPG